MGSSWTDACRGGVNWLWLTQFSHFSKCHDSNGTGLFIALFIIIYFSRLEIWHLSFALRIVIRLIFLGKFAILSMYIFGKISCNSSMTLRYLFFQCNGIECFCFCILSCLWKTIFLESNNISPQWPSFHAGFFFSLTMSGIIHKGS